MGYNGHHSGLADLSFGVQSSMTPKQLYEHATGKSLSPRIGINGVPVQTVAKGIEKSVGALSENVDDIVRDAKSDWEFYTEPLTLEHTPQSAAYKGDPYYHNILVGGCMAGGKNCITAASALPFGNLARSESKALFRWNEMDKVREEIRNAIAAGKHPRVVGHSWGGANIAGLAKDYPDVPFIALDPTSWTGRIDKTPANLTIFRPKDDSDKKGFLLAELAPFIGGRWPKIPGNGKLVEYNGGHVRGVDDAISKYVHHIRRLRENNERPTRLRQTRENQIVKKSSAGTVVPARRPMNIPALEKLARNEILNFGSTNTTMSGLRPKDGGGSTNKVTTRQPRMEVRTPSFQASPNKPLYPKQSKDTVESVTTHGNVTNSLGGIIL